MGQGKVDFSSSFQEPFRWIWLSFFCYGFICNIKIGVNCVQKFLLNNLERTMPTSLHWQCVFNVLFNSRLNPFGLIIALDEHGEASGSLFWDDGDSIGKPGPLLWNRVCVQALLRPSCVMAQIPARSSWRTGHKLNVTGVRSRLFLKSVFSYEKGVTLGTASLLERAITHVEFPRDHPEKNRGKD